MDRLEQYHVLTRLVVTGSFTACARAMGVTQPSVSKALAKLEAELGVRLISRSTRRLSLTEDGVRVHAHARTLLAVHDDLKAAAGASRIPAGVIRVACPHGFATGFLMPRLAAFAAAYPDIAVHLQISDAFFDILSEGIDLAFRFGPVAQQDLIVRKLGAAKRIVVAHTAYLNSRGCPDHPASLAGHDCILAGATARSENWEFHDEAGRSASVEVRGRIGVDNHLSMRTAVEQGLGIARAATFIFCRGDGLPPNLQSVLEEWRVPPIPVSALFGDRNLPRRTRVFLDFVHEELKTQPMLFDSG